MEFKPKKQKTRTNRSHRGDTDAEEKTENEQRLKTMEDDKLLLDAGIAADDMDEEEKKQLLEVLRESLPAVQITPKAEISGDDREDREEEELPGDSVQTPVVISADDDDGLDEEKDRQHEDPTATHPMDCDDELSCDSTTFTMDSKKIKNSLNNVTMTELSEKSKARSLRNTRLQRRKAADQSESSDNGTGNYASDTSENEDEILTGLPTHSQENLQLTAQKNEKLKLNPRQKECGQTRFKDIINKTNIFLSQHTPDSQLLSDDELKAQKKKRAIRLSQDLFSKDQSDEDTSSNASLPGPTLSLDPDPGDASKEITENTSTDKKRKTIQPHSSASHVPFEKLNSSKDDGSRKSKNLSQGSDDEETQPPDDLMARSEEEELLVDSDQEKTDAPNNQQTKANDHLQVSGPHRPTPQPRASSFRKDIRRASSSENDDDDDDDEDDEDDSPLLHDNWFSWPPVPSVCPLQRSYRFSSKRQKETSSEIRPYFCPESETPAVYSRVILQMIDSYLLCFARTQHSFQMFLPWGKPVHTGQHQPGTLDWKRRGELSFRFDWDNDDDNNELGQSSREQLSTKRGGRKDKGVESVADIECKKKQDQEIVADRKVDMFLDQENVGDGVTAYDVETQPYDTDDEWSDVAIGSAKTLSKSPEKENTLPDPFPVTGSQSSNSLLNEQGDLYSTQIPRRKRTAEMQNQSTECKRTRKEVKTFVEDIDTDGTKILDRPLSRKRKHVNSSGIDNPSYLFNENDDENDDDDDDEVSFPRKKKTNVRTKNTRMVHISVANSSTEKKTVKSAIVHPIPRARSLLGSNRGVSSHSRVLSGAGDHHFQPIKSSTLVPDKKMVHSYDVVDSDDAELYIESASPQGSQLQQQRIPYVQQSEQTTKGGADKLDDTDGDALRLPSEPMTSGSEQKVECPLCGKEFSAAVIQRHASDCNGVEDFTMEIQEPAIPLPAPVLKRRPLRQEYDREEFVCALCYLNLGGSGALKRHFEKCKLQIPKNEAEPSLAEADSTDSNPTEVIAFDRNKGRTTYKRSFRSKQMNAKKVFQETEGAVKRLNVDEQSTSAKTDQDHGDIDDLNTNCDVTRMKDGCAQNTNDTDEEENSDEEDTSSILKPTSTSKLEENPSRFKNNPQKRPTKPRERQ